MRRDAWIRGVGRIGGCLVLAACAAPAGNPGGTFHPGGAAPAPLSFSLFGPTDPARIDTPCAPAPPVDSWGDRCGRAGRISVEATERWPDGGLPCALHAVRGAPAAAQQGACIAGDELIAGGPCTQCRAMGTGWTFHGRVSALRPEQARALVARLGIATPDGRTPESADDWRALLAR